MFFILLLYGHVVLAGKRLLFVWLYIFTVIHIKPTQVMKHMQRCCGFFTMFPSMVFPSRPYPVDSILSAFWTQVNWQRSLRSRNRKHLGFLLDQAVMSEPLKSSHRLTAGWLHLCLTDITPVDTKHLTVSLLFFWYLCVYMHTRSKNVHVCPQPQRAFFTRMQLVVHYWTVVLCVLVVSHDRII